MTVSVLGQQIDRCREAWVIREVSPINRLLRPGTVGNMPGSRVALPGVLAVLDGLRSGSAISERLAKNSEARTSSLVGLGVDPILGCATGERGLNAPMRSASGFWFKWDGGSHRLDRPLPCLAAGLVNPCAS